MISGPPISPHEELYVTTILERRRTGWDVVLGIILLIGGVYLLSNAVLATAVSVLVLAWSHSSAAS